MRLLPLTIAVALSLALASCQEGPNRTAARHNIPINPQLMALMSEKGMHPNAPVLIRSFKKEAELEIWKQGRSGRYELLKSYPICRWSGQLGPKKREGDRQAPEGFYHITPAQMNPNSSFYLSFNMGYPNAYDRHFGRTGAHLMVHGACSSAGCYSMTDDQIAEIYALVREAHNGGQRAVQMQALPFRMTPENLARHRYDTNIAFWRNLKEGSDIFEVARVEPRVGVCQARYAFNRTEDCAEDPAKRDVNLAAAEKRRQDEAKVAELVARGTPAIRLVYQDGGQHQKFTQILMTHGPEALEAHAAWGSRAVGVSRPDAVTTGPQEIAVASTSQGRATAVAQNAPAMTPRPATAAARAGSPAAVETPATQVSRAQQPATVAVPTPQAQTASGGGFWQTVASFNPFAGGAPAAQPAAVTLGTPGNPTPQAATSQQRRAETPARNGGVQSPSSDLLARRATAAVQD